MNKVKFALVSCLLLSANLPSFADPAPDFTALVEKTVSSVVSIETVGTVTNEASGMFPDDLFNEFFGFSDPFRRSIPRQQQRKVQGAGSGFIISENGQILTNAHVVANAQKISVRLHDRREFEAELVGVDTTTDIALLKIKAENLPKATIGNSDNVKVGDWVLAIGAPYGFDETATKGIVSALGRNLPGQEDNYTPFIQTDAAINPGNSGGPLFNSRGEVIGINSQIYSRSGAFNGLGFAIPSNMAKSIAQQLENGGKVSRGYLGVKIQNVDQNLAESFGLEKPQGALIASVMENSPASKAGIKPGDVILSFDNRKIEKFTDLSAMVAIFPRGKKAEIEILRDKEKIKLQVEIADLNKEDDDIADGEVVGDKGKYKLSKFGITLENVNSKAREFFKSEKTSGVLISEVKLKSVADVSGIVAGDILVAVGGKEISNAKEAYEILKKASFEKPLPILIQRGQSVLFIPLIPQK